MTIIGYQTMEYTDAAERTRPPQTFIIEHIGHTGLKYTADFEAADLYRAITAARDAALDHWSEVIITLRATGEIIWQLSQDTETP